MKNGVNLKTDGEGKGDEFGMLINKGNLDAGIEYWLETKPRWPPDFHNEVYKKLTTWSKDRFTYEWWEKIVGELGHWNALRTKTKEEIIKAGGSQLGAMKKEYENLLKKGSYPELDKVEASDIRKLFELSKEIKELKGNSPVFPSKLCHFLFPSIFFVGDKEAVRIKNNDYFEYWCENKNEWKNCGNKEELVNILEKRIRAAKDFERPLFEHYPFATKIPELCRIGRNYKKDQ